ncbi:uncharacterized protein LOC143484434 isoform X2 [Brachyhypopomus gauderio]|uniref:uncharacterized protein LOC143484434 isoform X2 n=1 Tax=Brachyhypopomus gauderio TaxID=698409 RepID=UPI0040430DD8
MLTLKTLTLKPKHLFIMISCYELIGLINGYYLKDCTIKGPLWSQTMKVLCYKQKLDAVPEAIPRRARALDISYNNISVINKKDLVQLFNLRNLNISNNLIKEVKDGAFRDLITLQEMNLSNNKITTITEGFFQNLFNLSVLRLDKNHITNIYSSAFDPLDNLEMLNLSGNYLQHVYKIQSVFQIPYLQELHIGQNGFSSFQTWQISNISLQLKALDLSYNPLQLFRITADVFPHLETLDLAFTNGTLKWDVEDKNYFRNVNRLNLSGIQMPFADMRILQTFNSTLVNLRLEHLGQQRVKAFTKEACRIHSLKTLRLEANNISSISEEELEGCTGLTVLDMANNILTNIGPMTFKSMSKLNTLSLFQNQLNCVPTAIRNMSTLEILDLSCNSISILTYSDFSSLTNLKKLHVYKNPLTSLEHTFQNLQKLMEVFISSCRLITLKGYFKTGLQNLEILDSSENKLNIIHAGDLESLQNLTELHLNDNQIRSIQEGAFRGLHNLRLLNLQSNQITKTSMRMSVFSGLPKLKVLKLNNNHISYLNQESLRQPPFTYLNSLHSLAIFSQRLGGMNNIPSNFFYGLTSLEVLWAGNLNINSLHFKTFTYTPKLWLLDLSKNDLTSINTDILLPIRKLYSLTLIKTRLQSLDFLIQANLTEIKFLLIRKNSIALINRTVIESLPKLLYLNLQGNEFSCDCDNAWFINWTVNNNNTQVSNADQFKCSYPSNLRGSRLIELDINSCTVDVGYFCFISTTCLVLLTLFSSFLYHTLKWQVVYAYYLYRAFVYDKKQQKNPKFQGFQYDAFISYNTQDELWVMRELLPQLEGEQGWRLCLHHRDFQPGKPIIDNIVDGIYSSRKTICVISHHYLESEWCSREIQVASFRLFDEKKDVLILVFLEDIPKHELSPYYRMRSIIKKKTYLSWPKPGEDTQVFWQKLKVALDAQKDLS